MQSQDLLLSPEEKESKLAKLIEDIKTKLANLRLKQDGEITYDDIFDFFNDDSNQFDISHIQILETILKNITNLNSKNLSAENLLIDDNDSKIFLELFHSNIDLQNKLSVIAEICSKFPNLKSFSLDPQNLDQFYGKIGLGLDPVENGEIKSFISNQQYSSITQHNGYGPYRFFLTIYNGRILTSPQKEFREFYPIIVKEIFEKTGILDSQALQSYGPIFEDQNQAEKFLILLYKLARANDLLDLTENQKGQITSLFSNIENLTPQDDSLLDGIISQEDISLDQLVQFYKEKSIKDQISEFINSSPEDQDLYLGSVDQNSNLTKFLKVYQLFINKNLDPDISSTILNSLLYLNDQQIEQFILATSIIFDKHQRLNNQDEIESNIKMLADIFTARFIFCYQRTDSNNGVIIIDKDNHIKLILSSENSEDKSILDQQIKLNIFPIISQFDDKTYKDFFQRHLNDLLGTNYDFSNANITKENSQSFLQLTLLYSKSEITTNQQFKNNLTKLLEIIATNTSITQGRNDIKTDSQKVLDEINGCASICSQNFQAINKPKFQIFISSLASSANLSSANFSQNHSHQNQIQFGAGVFAMRGEENQGLNNIPQLPANFNQSPNYAHQLFLAEVLGNNEYASSFVSQAGENINIFLYHLFFNQQNKKFRELLGDEKYQQLQEKISQSTLICEPPAPNSQNIQSTFVTQDTLGNSGEITVGALIYDNALNMGIFNGVKLKLGLRINKDGSEEQGLFDDQQNLLIDSASLIGMYKKSGMNSDSLVSAITKFGSLNNSGNGQSTYIESDTTFSLRCLNGIWYLGIFQNKQDEQGNNQLEFRGAIKINNIKTIIKIPESTTHNNLDQTIQEERDERGIKNLGEVNSPTLTIFQSNSRIKKNPALTRTPSNISLTSDSSSRTILDITQSINSSIKVESRKLLSTGDEENAPKAHCCCNLFSRVSEGLIRMQKQASPIIKAIKSTNLSNLIKTFSQYR